MFPASPGSPGACGGPGSPATQSLDDLLTCPVCLESYTDPRTLCCLHSFCSKCLENCKRPYRRDIACPVCKKVTVLPVAGVAGLQNDFRIQQIRDILVTRPQSPPGAADASTDGKFCDACRSYQKKEAAVVHCVQCFMFFCSTCKAKHSANPTFSGHHVVSVNDQGSADNLFCSLHKEQAIRYVCSTCSQMLCTVCTMDHDPLHSTQPFDHAVIDRYRLELRKHQKSVATKLTEINKRSKYFETVKQSQQRALHAAQTAVKERAEDAMQQIKVQEKRLLETLQEHMDTTLKQQGGDTHADAVFMKCSLESLYADLTGVLHGPPQQCLLAYEDLNTRALSQNDPALPLADVKASLPSIMKFTPSESIVSIGSLRQSSMEEDSGDEDCVMLSSSPTTSSSSFKPQTVSRRVTKILNALSPARPKIELKKSKLKSFGEQAPTSPGTISADSLIESHDEPIPCSSPLLASSSPPPPSTSPLSPSMHSPLSPSIIRTVSPLPSSSADSDATPAIKYQPKLMFKLDQVGGWPGKVSAPTGVAFLPDGNVIIAECENRLQVFDQAGHSVRIIGWGKIRPCSVAVSSEGHIWITDKKDSCVKVYQLNGEGIRSWRTGQLSSPSGLALMSNHNCVVTDTNRHAVNIYSSDGTLLSQFGQWGCEDYQFSNPSHVTVDQQDNIFVSDSGNSCVKIYDKAGIYQRKISLGSSKHDHLRKPQGIAVDNRGHILVADRDNHRITMLTYDGRFICHLLTKNDGIRFPSDIAIDSSNHLAIVETHTGFLTKDPHHAVKLYNLNSLSV